MNEVSSVFKKQYALGKFVLCADAPEQFAGTVERCLARCASLQVVLHPARLEEQLRAAGIPELDAKVIAATFAVIDDTYAGDRFAQ